MEISSLSLAERAGVRAFPTYTQLQSPEQKWPTPYPT